MENTPDFLSELRKPEAGTAKDKKETSTEGSKAIKENFTSESYGWDSFFDVKTRTKLKEMVAPENQKEKLKIKTQEGIQDIVSEYVTTTNGLTGPEFYQAVLAAVKYEYEFYNSQAQKMLKVIDLLTPHLVE